MSWIDPQELGIVGQPVHHQCILQQLFTAQYMQGSNTTWHTLQVRNHNDRDGRRPARIQDCLVSSPWDCQHPVLESGMKALSDYI